MRGPGREARRERGLGREGSTAGGRSAQGCGRRRRSRYQPAGGRGAGRRPRALPAGNPAPPATAASGRPAGRG